MRDYNAIRFRSPKEKQQQQQNRQYPPQSGNNLPVTEPDQPNESQEASSRRVSERFSKRESRQEGSTSTVPSVASVSPVEQLSLPSRTEQQPLNSGTPLTASDALAMRRDGAEATILRLRTALDEVVSSDATSKSSLAQSDAVILELRSSVRQLKRQLEKVQEEKESAEQEKHDTLESLNQMKREKEVENDAATRETSDSFSRDARIGELQVQLDRAHAQILTADMVRKELEDTLEAEQYTWELRVQEQDRAIREWQDQCRTLQNDLEQCRNQWKDAEEGWTREVEDLQNQLDKAQQEATHWKSLQSNGASSNGEMLQMKEKLLTLEQERSELQSCLDDALKELEAVDAELQNDNSLQLREENERLQQLLQNRESDEYKALTEPMQHLYRWLLEREEQNTNENDKKSRNIHDIPSEPNEILSAIRLHLESMPSDFQDLNGTRRQIQILESQLSVYRGDLKAREESSSELVASLKEAVALLKPLQDAAAKADKEKSKLLDQLEKARSSNDKCLEDLKALKQQINAKDDEIDELKQRMETIELELSKTKLAAASTIINQSRNIASSESPDSLNRAREDLRSKRQSEGALKDLLRDAQTRLNSLHEHNQQVEAANSELQGKLRVAERSLDVQPSVSFDDDTDKTREKSPRAKDLMLQLEIEKREKKIKDLESQNKSFEKSIEEKDEMLQQLQQTNGVGNKSNSMKGQEFQQQIVILETDLSKAKRHLAKKKDSERTLKRSLKDALGLLKPLQAHLEESEEEKKTLFAELSDLRKRLGDDDDVNERSIPQPLRDQNADSEQMRVLQNTVKQLEKENSQLHDALEDMSQSFNTSHISTFSGTSHQPKSGGKGDARLMEEIVELKSRYQVTQGRLENSVNENRSISDALRRSASEEQKLGKELQKMRERLRAAERELENAKYIATSALVKVEELTMANVEQLSLTSSFDQDGLFEKKALELDYEMNKIRRQRT